MTRAYRFRTPPIAGLVIVSMLLMVVTELAAAQPPNQKKAAAGKPINVDPWYRPEGSIVEKSMRYYLWYEGGAWHLRSCSRMGRNFHGTLRVENGTVKSVLPVGLKEHSKTGDLWKVNDDRTELKFNFSTSIKSDGLDIQIDGDDAQVEFDLHIDKEHAPRLIFIGKGQKHPPTNPFTLPASPAKPKK